MSIGPRCHVTAVQHCKPQAQQGWVTAITFGSTRASARIRASHVTAVQHCKPQAQQGWVTAITQEEMKEYLMIGEVLKPQGLKGECKIKSCAADISLYETWSTVYRKEKGTESYLPLPLSLRRIHEGFVYAVLGDCRSPEDAERLRGERLYIDRAHAAPLEEGAVYIADLIGCAALDEQGQELGVLKDVLQNGPVDTWVFSGDRPFMAPALREVFPEVDPEARRISVCSSRLEEVAVFED